MKIGCHAMTEFFHSVHTGSLKKFGKLTCHTFNTKQVGMVSPFENKLLAYTGLISQKSSPLLA